MRFILFEKQSYLKLAKYSYTNLVRSQVLEKKLGVRKLYVLNYMFAILTCNYILLSLVILV